jgi:hypothetical protein
VIAVPASKADLFILYTADNDSDDASGDTYEGACVTLNITLVNSSTRTINGTTTKTSTYEGR